MIERPLDFYFQVDDRLTPNRLPIFSGDVTNPNGDESLVVTQLSSIQSDISSLQSDVSSLQTNPEPRQYFAKDSDTTLVNSVGPLEVFGATLPTGYIEAKSVVELEMFGFYSTANAVDTVSFTAKCNGVNTITVTSLGLLVAGANLRYRITFMFRTIGAVGSLVASQWCEFGIGSGYTSSSRLPSTPWDTTVDFTVSVTAAWSLANVGNSITSFLGTARHWRQR